MMSTYDNYMKNKAKPDLITRRNQGKGKSKRDGCQCCGCWFAKYIFSEHYVLEKSKQRLVNYYLQCMASKRQ